MYHEPSRYHHIMFSLIYKYVTDGQEYDSKVKIEMERKQKELEEQRNMIKASTESVFALAQDLNKRSKRGLTNDSDEGIYSSKGELLSQMSEEDDNDDSDVIISSKDKKKGKSKGKDTKKKREMTFVKKRETEHDDGDQSDIDKKDASV